MEMSRMKTAVAYFVVFLISAFVAPLSRAMPTGEVTTHPLSWTANVSTSYPPDNPLMVYLGDKLRINCPPNGISNVWILNYQEQYDQCKCNASGIQVETGDCDATLNTRQVCQDEIELSITSTSNDLDSAIKFEPGTKYYLISFAPLNRTLAGFLNNNYGGQCDEGFRMVLEVRALQVETIEATTVATTTASTTASDKNQPKTTKSEDKPTERGVDIGPVGSLVNRAQAVVAVNNLTVLSVLLLSLFMALW